MDDIRSDVSFKVELRRDNRGMSASKFRECFIQIFLDDTNCMPAIRAFDVKTQKEDFRVFLKDLGNLSSVMTTGLVSNFTVHGSNIYLKFINNAEYRKFHTTIFTLMKPSGPVSLATIPNAGLRRSPRRRNESHVDSSSVAENGSLENESTTGRKVLPKPPNGVVSKPPVDFLFGISGDGDEDDSNNRMRQSTIRSFAKRLPSNSKAEIQNRPTSTSASTSSKMFLPPDKENCHRTPVKTSSTVPEASEKRTPFSIKGDVGSSSGLGAFGNAQNVTHSTPNYIIPGLQNYHFRNGNQMSSESAKRSPSCDSPDRDASSKKPKLDRLNSEGKGVSHLSSSWKPSLRSMVPSENVRLKGFSNIGNTCYMNSILQALFGLDPFAKELIKNYQFFDGVINPDGLFYVLPALLGVKDNDDQTMKTDLLRKLKAAISSTATRFCGDEQHDAHEFLTQVLDQLKEEVNSMDSSRVSASDPPPNPVQNNFEFSVCHFIKCKSCQNVMPKEEQFNDLSLDLPLIQKNCDSQLFLQPLLDKFFDDHCVSYKCEICGGDSAVSSYKFTKLPRILTLHLKRYMFDQAVSSDMKIASTIFIPRYLSLNRLCSEETTNTSLLSESTKKINVTLVKPDSSDRVSENGTSVRAKRQLDFGEDDNEQLEESSTSRRYNFRRRDYNTRSGRSIYVDLDGREDEDTDLQEALERSRYETGPPGGYDDGQKFNDDVEEAIRLSLVDSGIPPDPDVVYFDESMPQGSITGNACDSNDAELILNAEDGHLEPSFRLCGVVNHLGSGTGSGHYTADVLDAATSTWRTYDDRRVSETTEDEVRKSRQKTAYIFFYMAKSLCEDTKKTE